MPRIILKNLKCLVSEVAGLPGMGKYLLLGIESLVQSPYLCAVKRKHTNYETF